LTDSFGLIPDAKPPKWRLAGLHWEKIRVRRMGFLNQAAEKRISSSRVGWRSWWVEDAVAGFALRTAQDGSRLESPLSQGSILFAGLDLYGHDVRSHLAIIGS
jgi:hypothetical protein